MSDGYGSIAWWGFSPSLDILKTDTSNDSNNDGYSLNIPNYKYY